jgi:hypothetical protein
MTSLAIPIFLILVGAFVIRAGAPWIKAGSRWVARDRWALVTGFVTAVTAFAIVSLPLDEVVIPGPIWLAGVGLLAGGVFSAALRWPDLPWTVGTHPIRRVISVSATLGIGALLIGVAVI